ANILEGHWSKRKDCFTGLAHGCNALLDPCRRGGRGTKLAGVKVNYYRGVGPRANVPSGNTADKTARVTHRRGRLACVDADGAVFDHIRVHTFAEVDVIGTCSYVFSCEGTHNRVINAAGDTRATVITPGQCAYNRVARIGGQIRSGKADGRVVKDGSV